MSTRKGKTQTDPTAKETSLENPEQNIMVTVDPETLTLQDWLTVQRQQLETIAESVGFRNTPQLSTSTLAQIIYEFYNPCQSIQQKEATAEQNIINKINSTDNVNNDHNDTITTTTNQSQKEGEPLEKLTKNNLKKRKIHETPTQMTSGLTAESIINIIDQRLANFINFQNTTASPPSLIGNRTNQPAPIDKSIFSTTTTTLQNGSHLNDENLALPAVPSTIIQRIQRGEFVNFDSLLPSNVGRASNSIISLKFDGESLSLSNNNDQSTTNILRTKNKVNDFHSWMLAWTLFYQIMVQHNSTLVHQLIKYQLFITNVFCLRPFCFSLSFEVPPWIC